jgi:phosphate transport system substrate-binding protein
MSPISARRTILSGFFLFGILLPILSCSRGTSRNEVIVAGSTSIQPFADRWAEVFDKKHPGVFVNIQGGGSSAGIQAAKSGAADIGMSSRALKLDEKDLLEIIVAHDGLAIIAHPSNPVHGLRQIEVRQIFSGEIPNWSYLGGPDKPITVVTREEGSGTRGAFQELVMGKERIFRGAIVQDSNGTVREIVANDPNAIGYISLGLVDRRVRTMALDGVAPSEASINAKTYKLVRPFLFVTRGELSGLAREFVDFILSPEGQDMARREGLLAIQ